MIKKIALISALALMLTGCDRNEVGDVSLGIFTLKGELFITHTLAS